MKIIVNAINVDGDNYFGEKELDDFSKVKDLLQAMDYDLNDTNSINSITNLSILVNGERGYPELVLKNGDLVHILTTLSGG